MAALDSFEQTLQSVKDLTINDGMVPDIEEDITDDDYTENEFLNSSSFLSNSQIIRSSNVNALKSANTPATMISSPTRSEHIERENKSKSHFQLFVPLDQQQVLNSDNSDDENVDKDLSDELIQSVTDIPPSQTRMKFISASKNSKFLDIDSNEATPKLPTIHPDTTPWRKLRPPSMFLNEFSTMNGDHMKSFFDNRVDGGSKSPGRSASMFDPVRTAGSEESSSTSFELNNLREQITNYKVQLRIVAEYIRTLLKTTNGTGEFNNELMTKLEKENGSLLSEREDLQNQLKNKKGHTGNAEPYDLENDPKFTEKIKEIVELKNDLISTQNLNKDLNQKIQSLELELSTLANDLDHHSRKSKTWEMLLNDLLSHLLKFLSGESAKAVTQALSGSMDTKIRIITFAINEILQGFDELRTQAENRELKRTTHHFKNHMDQDSPPPSSERLKISGIAYETINKIRSELDASRCTEADLKKLLHQSSDAFAKLKQEYAKVSLQLKESSQSVSNSKRMIGEKQLEISNLNDQILELESKSIEDSEGAKDTDLLKKRISLIKANHQNEVETLNLEIESLQKSLREQRGDKQLTEELLRQRVEIQDLNREIEKIRSEAYHSSQHYEGSVEELEKLLRDAKSDIGSLQIDYNEIQKALRETQEELLTNERDYNRKLDHAARELNQSVTKQRILAAEKSKLAFSVDDLKRENSKMNLNNNTMMEKINRLTNQVDILSGYEVGFNNLHKLGISNLHNLFNHFQNVLEPSSLSQADSKLKKLKDPNLVDMEAIHSLHRSLLSYFENAIVSIVNEYSEIYAGNQNHPNLEALQDEIEALNEELEWCYANGEFNEDERSRRKGEPLSPRTQMRLAELEKRRRMEREQRKAEHLTFSARIKTLERENMELHAKLEASRK